MAAALAAGALLCASAAPAAGRPNVTIAVLPRDTSVVELARFPGLSLGVMSAGIGRVPSEQTFLDVSQGNRIGDALYGRDLPGLFPFARDVPGWPDVIARADEAPADLVPGLLGRRLRASQIPAFAQQPMTAAAIAAADGRGVIAPLHAAGFALARPRLAVLSANPIDLPALMRGLRGDDLLIAIAAPPPAPDRALPIGIAGAGFDGNLTSDSTRTAGYVLSTDIAPTILRRFGLPIPSEMDGAPVRADGTVDPGAVEDLTDRMAVIPARRAPLLIACLASWIAIALAAVVLGRARRAAAAWLALAFAYMPAVLLAGAALEPNAAAEGVLVGAGAGTIAALTLWLARGWRGLALACAITVGAYVIDVLAGSGLTRLSLLGPNPIFGVRFYGIGNELEALIAVMVPVAVGAALSARGASGKPVSERGAVAAFLGAGLLAAVVFGAGHFGADVGAAIVLPVGAAVAAVSALGSGTSTVLGLESIRPQRQHGLAGALIVGAPVIALALLAFIDLVSGGNAHLTRSLLDAGGAGDLAEVAERRLRLSGHDFIQAAGNPLFWIVVVGIALAVSQWRRIAVWLRPAPMARAGLLGACAAVAAGVLVNDSGATFLVLGALALGAAVAFAWSQAGQVQ